MSEKELEKLETLVEFYCPAYNRTIEITHPRELVTDPRAAYYDGRKMVKFNNGLYATDDPEIIEALDKRTDVYRKDDPRVAALEEVNLAEPEDKARALGLLEKVGNIGSFDRPKANVPSLVSREK